MRAVIEHLDGEIRNRDWLTAWLGFQEMGYELLPFERGEVNPLEPDPEIVVVGGIASVAGGLRRLGIPLPVLPTIPEPLLPFAGRRVWSSTMGEVRRHVQSGGPPIFVKPAAEGHKRFPARVLRRFADLLVSASADDDEAVFCSEVVRFAVEYRCFVSRGELVDCRRYRGDFRLLPDMEVVDSAVAAFARTAPAGYALDVGVDADGRTLVIEVNDGYSLGSYGMEPVPYARLLAARWGELTARD